ncbi:hypothetical protein ABOM_005479 [Aspergillus bombycis]|uniref:Ent-kaurene synthase n=1 Tax=Aspergillus bombycis TaxID=109264 RepID=A0A1F8A325_9EURO|nr:hypothetical protein ABOM_005479 [Aspergillus bombycis]OGM45785.1 hypothetical protein ABOM_005479 [Aspergillus bombycis]
MAAEKRRKMGVEPPNLIQRAQQVVNGIYRGCEAVDGFSGFSLSLYDTAWVSMVSKADAMGVRQWVFPEAFAYVLRQQHDNGSWGINASPVDVILNTMAGLLALLEHNVVEAAAGRVGSDIGPANYEERVSRAITALCGALEGWDVQSTLHVGFEILVPCLLQQLAQRGVSLDFPGKQELMKLHQEKLSKFKPEMVISKQQTTLLHSLEGLIGKVEFETLKHHCTKYGGMMGSPASTAAYLMHSPVWDETAERYLRNVVEKCGSCGGVPSGFPTPIFESSWTISTLLGSGYAIEDFAREDIQAITTYLQKLFEKQHGLLGFAPGFVPDADDTARSLLALSYLKVPMDPSSLVDYFEAPRHFQTYKLERNPSFSANANTLLALLRSPSPAAYIPQIEKTASYLISCWEGGELCDKWNLAPEYSEMLLVNAFVELIAAWGKGDLTKLSTEIVTSKIPIVLSHQLSKALVHQHENGSWDNSVERTAYSILLLAYTLKLPWPISHRELTEASLFRGRDYLKQHAHDWSEGDYIWIEKVTYRLPMLAETYSLAAMKVSTEETAWTTQVREIFTLPEQKGRAMSAFFGQLPIFRDTPWCTVLLAITEAHYYSQALRKVRLDVFPRDKMRMTKDKYLDFIPVAWICVNTISDFPLSSETMWDMMVISMLNYQVDEYMESVVGRLPKSSLPELKREIRNACLGQDPSTEHMFDACTIEGRLHGLPPTPEMDDSQSHSTPPHVSEVAEVILKYIKHVRYHPCVAACPTAAQREVREELDKFLRAHMAHNADNSRLSNSDTIIEDLLNRSYFDWVRGTGAIDTSCPYSFSFFACLISRQGRSCISSTKQRYFARALALHLATMCRQFNDCGSQLRDLQEKNLNSLDFAEFNGDGLSRGPGQHKQDLIQLAEFERSCMEVCFANLSAETSATISAQIQAFIKVTDLFGQIYIAQDIASRLKTD